MKVHPGAGQLVGSGRGAVDLVQQRRQPVLGGGELREVAEHLLRPPAAGVGGAGPKLGPHPGERVEQPALGGLQLGRGLQLAQLSTASA